MANEFSGPPLATPGHPLGTPGRYSMTLGEHVNSFLLPIRWYCYPLIQHFRLTRLYFILLYPPDTSFSLLGYSWHLWPAFPAFSTIATTFSVFFSGCVCVSVIVWVDTDALRPQQCTSCCIPSSNRVSSKDTALLRQSPGQTSDSAAVTSHSLTPASPSACSGCSAPAPVPVYPVPTPPQDPAQKLSLWLNTSVLITLCLHLALPVITLQSLNFHQNRNKRSFYNFCSIF